MFEPPTEPTLPGPPPEPLAAPPSDPRGWGSFAASGPVGPTPGSDEPPTEVAYGGTAAWLTSPPPALPAPGPNDVRTRGAGTGSRGGWRSALVGGIVALAVDDDNGASGTGATSVVLRPSDRIGHTGDISEILQGAVPAVVAIVDDGGPDSGGAAGTGFVIDPSGVIVTNNHVVEGAKDIQAVFADGTTRDAKVLGQNAPSDLAVVKVDATGLPTIALGNSDRAQVGDDVVAIGNALALQGGLTVTRGIISGLHREVGVDTGIALEDVLQTDAAINPGNSGGPLVDTQGRVIGINTAIADPGSAQNVGFAIPISNAKVLIERLRQGKHPARLGVSTVDVDQAKLGGESVEVDEGAYVQEVTAGTPAAKAGIKAGDVVVAVDGKAVTSAASLGGVIRQHQPGDKVEIELDRDGDSVTVHAELAESPGT